MTTPWLCRHARRLNAALLSVMLCALPAFGETDAKAIMAGVYQQDTSHDATLRATLDITDKEGHTVKKRFRLSRVGSFGNGKTLVRFTDPRELRGVTLLSINEPGVTDRQWIYTPATTPPRATPPSRRARRAEQIPTENRMVPNSRPKPTTRCAT